MSTLYSFTSTNNYTGLNWNAATDNYAFKFLASATGIPNQLVLRLFDVVGGTPTCNVYIKGDKTLASTTYGSATGVNLAAGTNTITLTGGAKITNGNYYWVYFQRTSSASVYPRIYNRATGGVLPFYRSSASNIDPDTLYGSYDVSMDINGTLSSNGSNFFQLL